MIFRVGGIASPPRAKRFRDPSANFCVRLVQSEFRSPGKRKCIRESGSQPQVGERPHHHPAAEPRAVPFERRARPSSSPMNFRAMAQGSDAQYQPQPLQGWPSAGLIGSRAPPVPSISGRGFIAPASLPHGIATLPVRNFREEKLSKVTLSAHLPQPLHDGLRACPQADKQACKPSDPPGCCYRAFTHS